MIYYKVMANQNVSTQAEETPVAHPGSIAASASANAKYRWMKIVSFLSGNYTVNVCRDILPQTRTQPIFPSLPSANLTGLHVLCNVVVVTPNYVNYTMHVSSTVILLINF